MTTIAEQQSHVTVGVDTHADVNVAAVLDERGRLLATESFPTTSNGHRCLERWALGFGAIEAIGVEGTGSWGAGIARHLSAQGHKVLEIDCPSRQTRYRRGKSDTIDAEAAARAVLAGTATSTPKSRTGVVESIRVLRIARRSAVTERASTINRLHSVVSTAPDELRAKLRTLTVRQLVATCASTRPGDLADPIQATKFALRSLARRHQHLSDEIAALDAQLKPLVIAAAPPSLLARNGVGIDVAGQLLVTAGDNPDRLHSAAAFANLCGVAPIPVASGHSSTYRLNRGGDRAANAALYHVVIARLRWDPDTRAYIENYTKGGKTRNAAIRNLKHYIARQIYSDLRQLTP